LTESLCIYI